MRGALRLGFAFWTASLVLAPVPASAQEASPPANAQSTVPVGPKELQNFSLSGTVTHPADKAAETAPPATASTTDSAASVPPERRPARRVAQTVSPPAAAVRSAPSVARAQPELQQPVAPPPTAAPPVAASAPAPAPQTFAPPPEATGTLAPEHRLLVWPWLLAALVLAGAAAFLFWRNRSHRTALAGGPEIDLFGAPEPAPAPRPAPPPPPQPKAPEPPSPPVAAGIVSTGLRPWVDIRVQPLRCIITDQDATIEFELELFNSGSAPARGIHVAVALINAGEGQEEALSSFFAQEPGPGERMEVIQPLKRANFATQITIPRDQVRPLEMAGRQMFVPVLAFNAHYVWGSKAGQTSVSYLVGRDANGGKMSPFRLDLGPRVFRGLGARLLPTGIRS